MSITGLCILIFIFEKLSDFLYLRDVKKRMTEAVKNGEFTQEESDALVSVISHYIKEH